MINNLKRRDVLGFTLIEIIIVIVVMSILSTIMIVNYSSWKQSSIAISVKSDLMNAGAAMENARNYGTGYPSSLSGIYASSEGVVLSVASSDAKNYCIDATSSKDATVLFYIDSQYNKSEPQTGTCAGRAGVVGTPTGLGAATTSTSSITVTWTPVSGATGYNLQRSTNASFTDPVDITNVTSPYISTGLSAATTYYFRVQAVDASSSSPWSSSANAPTSHPSIATPSAPVVTANTVTSTTTYSWPNVTCATGQKVRYRFQYTISPAGYDSGWVSYGASLSAAFTTAGEDQYYLLAVQAQCYTADGFSAWSTSGTKRYFSPGTWIDIAVMCGIASNSQAYCWGPNYFGHVGIGTTGGGGTTAAVYSPKPIDTTGVLSGKTIRSISGGHTTNCAVASDGFAYCWGLNSKGQIGDNTIVDKSVPTAVTRTGALSGKTILKVVAGSHYGSCAIASDNYAYCWGDGLIVGDNTGVQKLVPTAVFRTGALNGLTIKDIEIGRYDVCAIASNNLPYCWGIGQGGVTGNGTASGNNLAPVPVTTSGALSGKTVKKITVAVEHACVIASDDKPYCWGDNTSGQIGDGTSGTDRLVPTAVVMTGALNGLTVKDISVGSNYTCVIASNDKPYCWGLNDVGQSTGPPSANLLVPTAVINSSYYNGAPLKKLRARIQIGAGTTYALALNGGKAYVWGSGGSGGLGDGGSFNYNEVRPICNPFWKTTCYGIEP